MRRRHAAGQDRGYIGGNERDEARYRYAVTGGEARRFHGASASSRAIMQVPGCHGL